VCWLGARELKKPDVERWSKPLYDAFLAGAWSLYWTDDTLFWVAKPTVHREEMAGGGKRLHNDRYAALESDIENLYFWHGVLVPAFVVVRPDWITLKDIDAETNAEVRRVMIERYKAGEEINGAAAYMRDAGGKRLDLNKPCAECGRTVGVAQSGICLSCTTKAMRGMAMKSAAGRAVADRWAAFKRDEAVKWSKPGRTSK
jgi:hypothetical protein